MNLVETMRVATAAHQSGQLLEAARMYTSVIEFEPMHADALHQFGLLCHQLGRHSDACDLIRQAVVYDQSAQRHEYLTNLATVLLSLGEYENALEACEQADPAGAARIPWFLSRSQALRQLGRYAESIGVLKHAVAEWPASASLWNALASARQEMGDNKAALADYERAIQADPSHAASLLNATSLRRDLGLPLDAEWTRRLEQALGRSTDMQHTARLEHAIATALESQENTTDAFAHYQRYHARRKSLMKLQGKEFAPGAFRSWVEQQIAWYQACPPLPSIPPHPDTPTPCFIVGLPHRAPRC